jgi:cobalamin biosynthesis protein CobD/CbiB
MPRPVSWLPRLHEISRSVANSVRSHYDRGDLETLFQLQPRAAQKLLEMLPSVLVGTSRLVERAVLASFLDRVRDADDVTALYEQIRQEKAQVSHRKVRTLVRRDLDPIGLGSLPSTITLTSGRFVVDFTTVEQLAEAMYALARVIESEGDLFARHYEPQADPTESEE